MSALLHLFLYYNTIVQGHGARQIDIVENRFVGIIYQSVYETPEGTLLRAGHLHLKVIFMDREVKHITKNLARNLERLCYYGF